MEPTTQPIDPAPTAAPAIQPPPVAVAPTPAPGPTESAPPPPVNLDAARARRKTRKELREAARERDRQRRERQRADRDEAAKPKPTQAAPTRTPEQEAAALAKKEAMVRDALAGTVELLADGVHMLWMETTDPHIGDAAARRIGELWAPILAPHIDERAGGALPIILASGGTAGVALGWASAVRASRAKSTGGKAEKVTDGQGQG